MDHISIAKIRDLRDVLIRHSYKKFPNRSLANIKHIAVHHSLTATGSAESFARYHVQHNKWPGIGYHFVVEANGKIKWCNDLTAKSYHVGNSNRSAIGVCMTGDFRTNDPTKEQLVSLKELLKYLMRELSISPENVKGHSEFPNYSWKACPCINMDELRNSLKPNSIKPTVQTREGTSNDQIKQGISLNWVIAAMKAKNHRVFEKDHKPYNLNIVGIRSSNAKPNAFDDHLTCFYKYQGKWHFHVYPATTDPGLYYLNNPINVSGTAILKPGQYRRCHQLGLHRGRYQALKQIGAMTVYRDNDRDGKFDLQSSKTQSGIFGINIHRASSHTTSRQVDRWSAGCQVVASPVDFKHFMDLCRKAAAKWGSGFTYTLLSK